MNVSSQKIVLAGGSGFLGRALAEYFARLDYEVVILTRSPRQTQGRVREAAWDARTCGAWQRELEGAQAVVNLTGKSVNCRCTPRNRNLILESRTESTRAVGEAIQRCQNPPAVWLNASTATIYKHSLDQDMDEQSETGATPEAKDAFSVDVARAWESALTEAKTPSTRKVAMRITMVLGLAANSVVPTLCRLARFGLGGTMASGRQYVSWIHQEDFCRATEWVIDRADLEGPVNFAAPNPLPNREMMRLVRKACGIPLGLPAAAWMLEIGAWIMRTETELIIKSRRVVPGRLLKSGFQFKFSQFETALRDLIG